MFYCSLPINAYYGRWVFILFALRMIRYQLSLISTLIFTFVTSFTRHIRQYSMSCVLITYCSVVLLSTGCSEKNMKKALNIDSEPPDELSVFTYKPLQMPQRYDVVPEPTSLVTQHAGAIL